MKRRTKIICTLGPASWQPAVIRKMAREGMDIARINFSHGELKEHQNVVAIIRRVNKSFGRPIKLLGDLEGYRIRLGFMKKPIELKRGQTVWLSGRSVAASGILPLDADFDVKTLRPGMHVFIADGMIDLEVNGQRNNLIKLEVRQGGVVSSKKGVNIPGLKLKADILTDKDKEDIEFAIAQKFDFVAQSFVRNNKDILSVAQRVKPRLATARIIAKIENKEGVRNIDSIMDSCDGIMVARGDMGVSLPIYQVPMIQKDIIRLCDKKKKLDITATQMLESMTENLRPTRAEVSDVANAVLDGSDCVMLSGETAVGRYPVETVRMMRQIIEYTEGRMKKRVKR